MTKKAAKVLSIALTALVAVTGLAVTGWFVYAQEENAGSGTPGDQLAYDPNQPCNPRCWQRASDTLAPLWEQAEEDKEITHYADAALLYLSIADRLPESAQAMKALLEAAACTAQTGRFADAIGVYDRAIAIGNKYVNIDYGQVKQFGWNQTHFPDELKAMKPLLYDAMMGKAEAYHRAGNLAEAKRALECIRATFADCDIAHRDRTFPLQAEIEGVDATALWAFEWEASTQFEQAHAAFRNKNPDAALEIVERILASYPGTMAAVRALDLKARALWQNHRFDEAVATYSEVLARVENVAPECEFARVARSRIAWFDCWHLNRQLVVRHAHGEAVSSEDWQRVRDLCRESNRANREWVELIQSDAIVASSYYREGRYEAAVQAVDDALENHYLRRCGKLRRLKAEVADLQHWAGYALAKMGQGQEAQSRFDWILQSVAPQAVPSEDFLVAYVHYWTWEALRECTGYESAASEAANLLQSRYPNSRGAELLRERLEQ